MVEFLDVMLGILEEKNHDMVKGYGFDELRRYPSTVVRCLKDVGYIDDIEIRYMFPTYESRLNMVERWKQIVYKISSEFSKYNIKVDVDVINNFYTATLMWDEIRSNQSKDIVRYEYLSEENGEFENVYSLFCNVVDSLHSVQHISEKEVSMSEDEKLGLAKLLLEVLDIASYTCDEVSRSLAVEHSIDMFGYRDEIEIVDDIDNMASILSSFKDVIKNSGYHY